MGRFFLHKNRPLAWPSSGFFPGCSRCARTGLGALGDPVNALMQVAGKLVPLVVGLLKKPPVDQWSIWNEASRKQYVTEALQIATTLVLTGKSLSVTETFQKLIARVERNDNWYKWKKKNSPYLLMLWQAQDETERYKRDGYSPDMKFINPRMIDKTLHPHTFQTGFYGLLLGGMGIFFAGKVLK